jgi:hypothetical protein
VTYIPSITDRAEIGKNPELRTVGIYVKVTESERAALRRHAKEHGTTVSDLLRDGVARLMEYQNAQQRAERAREAFSGVVWLKEDG